MQAGGKEEEKWEDKRQSEKQRHDINLAVRGHTLQDSK
jgi:hypothetical protein